MNIDDFFPFLKTAKQYLNELDVMIEAKKKDDALFDVMKQMENLPGVSMVNQAAIRID